MSVRKRGVLIATAIAAGAMLGAAPAIAWPIPYTAEDIRYLDATRGNFPGDDDQLLLAGKQVCRQLYTGQSAGAVTDQVAAQYGASPEQAATVVRAARNTMCTQAPG
ncbi:MULTISPECIES: DUF732 domain-containing protein [Mycolicibacter]|uniref:DUF732 domain-containing protein n=1 Tax=Mycolicibacter TaxID=1073531 RepID=UPI0007EACD5F|nr:MULTISPECIES: DUF732 domain-containing protein [Mycolicibacter]OBG38708.1 hypothetical protein A5671_17770 [Mycolicibacter heraklionensis]OBJ30113.1 hypothetical protein A5631_15795 [Mycolicibacter heraklionensis]ULP46094.1 DUF732 domain-containing protein [Mycolicibacter virginiensis]